MSRNPTPLSLATPQPSSATEAWAPVAPYIPSNPDHKDQRYFSRSGNNHSLELASGTEHEFVHAGYVNACADVKLYRNARYNTADLTLVVRVNGSKAETTVECTAAELRAIAYRLLDAAHDIDTHPASQLMQVAA